MTIRRSFFFAFVVSVMVSGPSSTRVYAGPPEGRPTAQVPVGANVTQIAPTDGGANGVLYERMRIKRTVPLDPAGGLDGKWDTLYSVQDPSGTGQRVAYLDWDDNYLYLALEIPQPAQARFDIDGQNDGWLRGADNLSLIVTPPVGEGSADPPRLTAQRFDMAQNRDQPVWAASPISESDIIVHGARTPRGTYAMTLAIPRTEAVGLTRKPGESFGVRVDSGSPLPPNAAEIVSIPVRPMLRITLADQIEASGGPLTVRVIVNGARDITPGGEVRTTLEITNTGSATKRLTRLFLRGSMGDGDYLDERKFAGEDVEAGKTIKRDMRSSVAPAAPVGALVMTGGADVEEVGTLAALTSINKVEPYALTLDVDAKPVPAGGEGGGDARRSAKIILRSRSNTRVTAKVTLKLPENWHLESGELQRDLALTFDGDVESTTYKVIVPPSATLGAHALEATAEVAGRTYRANGTITLVR